MAYRILVLQLGMEPGPPVVKVPGPNLWTTKGSPHFTFKKKNYLFLIDWLLLYNIGLISVSFYLLNELLIANTENSLGQAPL